MSISAEHPSQTATSPSQPQLHIVPPPRSESTPLQEIPLSNPAEAGIALAAIFRKTRVPLKERDAERARLRRDSVGKILESAGVITPEFINSPKYVEQYRDAEEEAQTLLGQRLSDLADKYDEHPFTETIDVLQKELRTTQYGADVILMRRTGLLLLEHSDAQ